MEQRQVAFFDGEKEETYQYTHCDSCHQDFPTDQQDSTQHPPVSSRSASPIRPEVNVRGSSKQKTDGNFTVPENIMQAGAVRKNGTDVTTFTSKRHGMTSQADISLQKAQDIVFRLPCKCGTLDPDKLLFIEDRDGHILARQCSHCQTCTGVDDSLSMEDLASMLEESRVKVDPCLNCGNDDPYEIGCVALECEQFILVCKICNSTYYDSHTQSESGCLAVPDEEKATVESDQWNTPHCAVCKNENDACFSVHFDEIAGVPVLIECLVCGQFVCLDASGTPEEEMGRGASQGTKFKLIGRPIGRRKLTNTCGLVPGDHIAWHQKLAYWHHALITKISRFDPNRMKVIHYTGPDQATGVVREEWHKISREHELYCIDYNASLPADEVLARARSRLGEKKYCLLSNNCEHFARWCKTGLHESDQVLSFHDAVKRIGQKGFAFSKALNRTTAEKVWSGQGHLNKGTRVATGLAASEAIGNIVVIEAKGMMRDVFRAYQQKQSGMISHDEYVNVCIKRASQGISGATGSIAGGFLGQAFIPVPVLGGFVGATVGSLLGESLGLLVGRKLVGNRHKNNR